MADTAPPLVDVAWVAAHGAGPGLRLIDLRWSLSAPAGRSRYEEGHLPGAVFVDLDLQLSGRTGPGRHPLPPPVEFAALLARLGIDATTHVVVYDEGNGSVAARLWFMLRIHGHGRASVLDGGIAAWREAGLPLAREVPAVRPAPLRPLPRDESRLVDRAFVAARMAQRRDPASGTLLLDARSSDRYRGEVEPVDPRAGHIPGAVNAPFAGNLRDGLRFLPAPALRARYAALGADRASEIVASCGSGVTACHALLALELPGRPRAKLYVGSWSDWCGDPKAPIATGDAPG